jgi:hypothetical protein
VKALSIFAGLDPSLQTGEVVTSSTSTETLAAGAVAKDPRRWLALAVIASSQLMVILDASIVTIALPVGAA